MTKPDPQSQSDADAVQAELDAALKNKFRSEYAQTAKTKLNLLDAFKKPAQRLQKIETITEKLLDRDIANGKLQARAQAEVTEDQRQEAIDKKTAETKPLLAPGSFDFIDWNPHSMEDMRPQHAAQIKFDVRIPNVPSLQTMPDDMFLKYVLSNLHSYDISTASYREPKELELVRKGLYPKGAEQPTPMVMFLEKKFNVVGDTELIVHDPAAKGKMTLMYSNHQQEFIETGAQAVQSFNAHGKIGLRTRENFILEHLEEILRTAGYAPTVQYENFCQDMRHQVAMQMQTFGNPSPQTTFKVSYNVDLNGAKPAPPSSGPKS